MRWGGHWKNFSPRFARGRAAVWGFHPGGPEVRMVGLLRRPGQEVPSESRLSPPEKARFVTAPDYSAYRNGGIVQFGTCLRVSDGSIREKST